MARHTHYTFCVQNSQWISPFIFYNINYGKGSFNRCGKLNNPITNEDMCLNLSSLSAPTFLAISLQNFLVLSKLLQFALGIAFHSCNVRSTSSQRVVKDAATSAISGCLIIDIANLGANEFNLVRWYHYTQFI